MPKARFELIPYVDETIETMANGNITDGVFRITDLPKRRAVAVAAYVVERTTDTYLRSIVLRLLEKYADNR